MNVFIWTFRLQAIRIKNEDFTGLETLDREFPEVMQGLDKYLEDNYVTGSNKPLVPSHKKVLMEFYSLILKLFTPKSIPVEPTTTQWITHWKTDSMKYSFIEHAQGFQHAGAALKNLTTDPIALLIGDSNYGVGREGWDDVAWSQEFKESIDFVVQHNRGLQGAKFAWFVRDKQLVDCITACTREGLNFKLITWVKPFAPFTTGQRFRHDAEFIVLAWVGNESHFVTNIDKHFQERCSTVIKEPRVSRPLKTPSGEVVNPYQKPVNVMMKIINMACDSSGLIVDITCGTGTTAVSVLKSNASICSCPGRPFLVDIFSSKRRLRL